MPRAGKPFRDAAGKAQDLALPDIGFYRAFARAPPDQMKQNPPDPAMRNDTGIAADRPQPRIDPRGDHRIALATRRLEIPAIVVAIAGANGIAQTDLRPGLSFPDAEADLAQPRVIDQITGLKVERLAQDTRRLARAQHRAGMKRNLIQDLVFALLHASREMAGNSRRLPSTMRIECDIRMALKPPAAIPVGLAVPDEVETGHVRLLDLHLGRDLADIAIRVDKTKHEGILAFELPFRAIEHAKPIG